MERDTTLRRNSEQRLIRVREQTHALLLQVVAVLILVEGLHKRAHVGHEGQVTLVLSRTDIAGFSRGTR